MPSLLPLLVQDKAYFHSNLVGGKLDCLLLRVDARENLAQASFTGST